MNRTLLTVFLILVALLIVDLFLLSKLTPRVSADEPMQGIRLADEDFQPWPGPTEVVVPVPVSASAWSGPEGSPTILRSVDGVPRPRPSFGAGPGALTSPLFGVTGTASWMPEFYGPRYLALPVPWGPGWAVRICGAGGCWSGVSTDTGPIPSLHRVADIAVGVWEQVTGLDRSLGVGIVTVTVTGRAA